MCLVVKTIQWPPGEKEEKEREKEAFFGDEQVQDPEWWSEEDFTWWSKGKKGKKGSSRGKDGFHKSSLRPYQTDKRCKKGLSPKERHRKGSNRKRQRRNLSSIRIVSLRNTNIEGHGAPGNQTIGLPVIGLTIPGLQMQGGFAQRLILHGWWQLH